MFQVKELSDSRLKALKFHFKRYLYDQINWDNRFIGILGARGVGKTTLLLQRMKEVNSSDAIYVSLDGLYFSQNSLFDFAKEFHSQGGLHLFLDEVHKYPNWSQELKNIYDFFPALNIVFTSSSALEIHKGQYDLSRRLLSYNFQGLSFREFLLLKHEIKLPVLSLKEVLEAENPLEKDLPPDFFPYKYLHEYLLQGYYPFFLDDEKSYKHRLLNAILLVLESDLPAAHFIDYYAVMKLKKLLYILARIVPFKPNISELARQLGTTRDTILKYLSLLHHAHILRWLSSDTFGVNFLNKPDKIYLENTNIAAALNADNIQANIGNIRETFVLNQLNVNHNVTYPKSGDFLVDGQWLLEVGGKSKQQKQIAGIENAFVVSDGLELRIQNKIPLWYFGLLY